MLDARKIWSSSQLPSLPAVAVKLLDLSRDAETEIKDVVGVIRTDPAISAKILKAANSSYYSVRAEVANIDRAVSLLGTNVVTSMALSFSLVEAAMSSGPLTAHYKNYWVQSVVQAVTAETLAKQSCTGPSCDFFLAGLLMDLGRLALLKTVPREYLPVLLSEEEGADHLHEIELRLIGIDHIDVGARMMENWKLPQPLIEASRRHHASVQQLAELPAGEGAQLSRVLAVAAAVGDYLCAPCKGKALDRLHKLASDCFGFAKDDVERFLAKARDQIREAGDVFSVDAEQLGEPADLMAMANDQLAQLAVRQQAQMAEVIARQQTAEREKRELELKNRQLQEQALRDPLTQCYNRNFFDESIEKEIHRASRTGDTVGVIFADIDRFKLLNDTYGHQFGDQVLQQVAKAYGETLRASDVLARFGGEEFVVMVSQPTEKGIEKVAERLRARIEAEEVRFGETPVKVTVSVGAAIALPGRRETDLARRLIAAADEAMYDAKNGGRNQIRVRSLLREEDRRMAQLVSQKRFSRWLVAQQILDVPTISKALVATESHRVRIGELAQSKGYLTAHQVLEILNDHENSGDRFGAVAVRLGHLTEEDVAQLLAFQQECPLQVASTLIRMQILTQAQSLESLQAYLTERAPSRPASDGVPAPPASRRMVIA